nr:MAG TPA: hypothetical protein [Caudoviricetes sp.]
MSFYHKCVVFILGFILSRIKITKKPKCLY